MNDSAKIANLDENLSRRLHRALTAGKEELFMVVDDPSMEVLQAALKNPFLDEHHILALLQRRDLSEELLKRLYASEGVIESHNVKVALVHNPATPGPIVLALLPHLYLFELVSVCYLPGATPDQRLAAERAIIQRLPTTPLGNKLTLARRGTANILEALLKEGDPRMFEACLDNPYLKEAGIFRFLNGPTASPDTISMVARHPRWKTRPNIVHALLRNQKTPLIWFNLFLPTLPTSDMRNLLASRRLTHTQKKSVEEELRHRG